MSRKSEKPCWKARSALYAVAVLLGVLLAFLGHQGATALPLHGVSLPQGAVTAVPETLLLPQDDFDLQRQSQEERVYYAGDPLLWVLVMEIGAVLVAFGLGAWSFISGGAARRAIEKLGLSRCLWFGTIWLAVFVVATSVGSVILTSTFETRSDFGLLLLVLNAGVGAGVAGSVLYRAIGSSSRDLIFPDALSIRQERRKILYEDELKRASKSTDDGKWEDAILEWGNVIRGLPNMASAERASAYERRAYCHGQAGNRTQQLENLRKALALAGNDGERAELEKAIADLDSGL